MCLIVTTRSFVAALSHRILVSTTAAMLVTACAVPNKLPESFSASRSAIPQEVTQWEGLLIIIRIPTAIEDRALQPFLTAYRQKPLAKEFFSSYQPEGSPLAPQKHRDPQEAVHDALSSTLYYAADLRALLAQKLGPNRVALLPARIVMPTPGSFALEHLQDLPPAPVVVDFFTYNDTNISLGHYLNTFGQYMTPLFTVRTSVAGAPQTDGALAGMQGIDPRQGGARPNAGVLGGLGATLLSYLSNAAGEKSRMLENAYGELPVRTGQYLRVPLTQLELPTQTIEQQAKVPGGLGQKSSSREALEPYANGIVELLGAVNTKAAVAGDWQRWASVYDPLFGSLKTDHATAPQHERSRTLLGQLLTAEAQYFAVTSERLSETVQTKELGDSFRKALVAQADVAQRVRTSENTTAIAMVGLSLLTMGAGGLVGPAMLAAAPAMSEAQNMRSMATFQAYQSAVASLSAQQVEINVGLAGGEKIYASSLSDLRAKLKAFYAKATR